MRELDILRKGLNFERYDRPRLDYLITNQPHTSQHLVLTLTTLKVVDLALNCSYKRGEFAKTDRENPASSDISDLFFRALP